ncbi:MAG: hypothetical protein WD423_07140 [Rhodothermales bacterium]
MRRNDLWLMELYEGSGSGVDPSDSEDAAEAAALREMKVLLDARSPGRPDPATLDAVFAAARGDGSPRGVRQDRPPQHGGRSVGLRVGAASALVVLLIGIVGIVQLDVFTPDAVSPTDGPASIQADAAPAIDGPAGGTVGAVPEASAEGTSSLRDGGGEPAASGGEAPGPTRDRGVGATIPAFPDLSEAGLRGGGGVAELVLPPAEVPSWDERDDVIELHKRIERIGSGVDEGWGTPAVPLEMMPGGQGNDGILPAGERR